MPNIILIGINHKTAPVALREKLSFSIEETLAALETLKQHPGIKEILIFSTCNRTEILYVASRSGTVDTLITFLSGSKQISPSEFVPALYILRKEEAIHHLFRVAASLDSMMVGEPQILGQIKLAYRTAVKAGTSKVLLNRMMHKSFSVAKKVRKETGIGDNAVSISYAAIELANKIFSDLSTKTVMLLGAGEMAELAVEHLISHNVGQIRVSNRTFENAVALAERFKGRALGFEERVDALTEVDIIISSTGATDYVITADQVKKAMKKRKYRTLFFIDIAVPRDIDPKINQLSNVYVYDIDDLKTVVASNIQQREQETVKAERFVSEAVIKFRQWLDSLAIVPTIKALNEKMTGIVEMECDKTLSHLSHLAEPDKDAIRRMTQAIATRAIHDPIMFLKHTGGHRDDSLYLNVARQLFNLDMLENQ
jgi:glutamyl-tRNA reductase